MQLMPDYQVNTILKHYSIHLNRRANGADGAMVTISAAAKREAIINKIAGTISDKINRMRRQAELQGEAANPSAVFFSGKIKTDADKPGVDHFRFTAIDEDGEKTVQTCLIGATLFKNPHVKVH